VGASWQGDIALDDTSLTSGPCPASAECDFEVDMCGYIQSQGDDQFDWTRHANATASVGTGPSNDHTTRNGYGRSFDSLCQRIEAGEKKRMVQDLLRGFRSDL